MMQIVGAPCLKAGPSANGKDPAARLSDLDGMVVNGVDMSHMVYMGTLKPWHGGECCERDAIRRTVVKFFHSSTRRQNAEFGLLR